MIEQTAAAVNEGGLVWGLFQVAAVAISGVVAYNVRQMAEAVRDVTSRVNNHSQRLAKIDGKIEE